ncbi:HNH endonuclease signature motif containing protein [Aspergillus clavatus NRRL 1]|uniref:Uncharacterized protein n=1 Tax=Aspergillus clavatus (strain ATCC 1007 / CBS 513.65 / DSM 816 / NCTC 3887 / NRRL 1 / QM 1276 / 107) TaxID=344612 RepID=A1CHP5_ASPCL|nr:uncharacterized protein ACLA_048720 [Aspergillus clavatus NRRL 1]EAW10400.1 hypothetical protein ACLA_048720 [Aspergillus clavatus NRRL 1]
MASRRASTRNVFIEFSHAPGEIKGGLSAAPTLTTRQFLDMIYLVFHASGGFETRLYRSTAPVVPSDQPLEHGRYILTPSVPDTEMQVSHKCYHPRTLSLSNTARNASFAQQVRARDGRCVITGQINRTAEHDIWVGFDAAHIFPLALDSIFASQGFQHVVTHNDPLGVNSLQNGLLLDSAIHHLWDWYSLAVNPNDGYKVVSFQPHTWDLHGRILDPVCRQPGDPTHVLDALLQWHYEQAVLCNVRGEGEAAFEFDFPEGSDMMGQIQEEPQGAERMEAELFNRLWGHYESPSLTGPSQDAAS